MNAASRGAQAAGRSRFG